MMPKMKLPLWFWIIVILLALWQALGCFACIQQMRLGAAAIGPVDEWSLKYYAALPAWYNGVYAVATFGGLFGSAMLIARDKRATYLFWMSFAAVIVIFGYAFVATDLIAHKGLGQVLPFPLIVVAISAFSIWFTRFAASKNWLGG